MKRPHNNNPARIDDGVTFSGPVSVARLGVSPCPDPIRDTNARFWATIRILTGEVNRLNRILHANGLDATGGAPFYEIWFLYWRVFWGWIWNDKASGHRLEYARNLHALQCLPLMMFIRTAGIRYRHFRDRCADRARRSRERKILIASFDKSIKGDR